MIAIYDITCIDPYKHTVIARFDWTDAAVDLEDVRTALRVEMDEDEVLLVDMERAGENERVDNDDEVGATFDAARRVLEVVRLTDRVLGLERCISMIYREWIWSCKKKVG